MTQAIPFWHVDAFAARPFCGNQAAVMMLEEWLPDDVLIAIAKENMFSATAFLLRDATQEADWELCWFSRKSELTMCGHATLASGHAILEHSGGDRVTFRSRRAGILEVRRKGDGYEVGLPAIATEPRDYPEAVASLGAEPLEVRRNETRYNILLFQSEAAVRALDPDLRGLARLGNDQFICTAPGERTDMVSRVFVPGGGVDEDSVTGSAHAVLAPFWAERLGRSDMTAYQASARGGDLTLQLEGERVWLGGPCVTVVKGSFYLSG
ncbi:MAG: PhzF family phenazine biosynthesis protein [Erythrobacter sp.]|nr:PhzF family phenazine biosynthesis protein [Erythrobacter sp.]